MYNYTYLVRVVNLATGEIYEQWNACVRPLTGLRRFQRLYLPYIRVKATDIIRATVYDKKGNIYFEGDI